MNGAPLGYANDHKVLAAKIKDLRRPLKITLRRNHNEKALALHKLAKEKATLKGASLILSPPPANVDEAALAAAGNYGAAAISAAQQRNLLQTPESTTLGGPLMLSPGAGLGPSMSTLSVDEGIEGAENSSSGGGGGGGDGDGDEGGDEGGSSSSSAAASSSSM